MFGKTVLDAGTVVVVLTALFFGLLTLAVALTVLPGVPDAAADLVSKIVEWAGLTFGALLAALGMNKTRGGDGK